MLNMAAPSLADIAAVTRNNEDGFGGNNGWWVLIILFALFGGWGNNGYGNGNGGTNADIQRGFDTQAIVSKLDGINNGLCSLGYDQLNQMNGIQTAVQQAANNIISQISNCCCENRTGQMQIMNQMSSDTCAITNEIRQAAQNIMQNDNNNYQRLHDENIQLLLSQKDEKIAELTNALNRCDRDNSNNQQTTYLLDKILPTPRPCYVVANPNCCGG